MGPHPYVVSVLTNDRERVVQRELRRRSGFEAGTLAPIAISPPELGRLALQPVRVSWMVGLRVALLLLTICALSLHIAHAAP
jgi:hypothetical protein